jgi:hypothetical protein
MNKALSQEDFLKLNSYPFGIKERNNFKHAGMAGMNILAYDDPDVEMVQGLINDSKKTSFFFSQKKAQIKKTLGRKAVACGKPGTGVS